MSKADFGNLIYKRRKRLGIRQEGLAQMMRLSQGTISKMESGKAEPTLSAAARACEALRIPPSRAAREILKK